MEVPEQANGNVDESPKAPNRMQKYGRHPADMTSNHEIQDGRGNTIKVFKYDGILFPPFGDLAISKMKDTVMRDDDVFISGYPKTGCHWTYELVSMIRRQDSTPQGGGKGMGFLELASPEVVTGLPSPRTLNSHVTFEHLPTQLFAKKTKIILTIRNFKDTLVSYFHHHSKIHDYTGTLADHLPLNISGKLEYGGYFDMYKDWNKTIQDHPDHPIIVMSYEDMKEDLPREVRRLAKFLEVDLDEPTVEAIARAGQFDSIKKSGAIPGFVARKGQVGDWKNWLTVAQNEMIDAVLEEKMSQISFYKPRYTLA